ncbi:hypothetical protein [Bdellovibrio sp. HCB337]|uniref:hypothetical protein n=1 Tax=Bdellovibrio sp. HCB337 TaxID=3394358 RepID=UPI0039A44231
MFKMIFTLLLILSSTQTYAVEVLVDRPEGEAKGLVIVAPAKKYLMKERLFSGLAEKLKSQGFITVRFNWSEDTLQVPEQELRKAARDIHEVTTNAQKTFGFGADQTVLISKSFSTKALDPSIDLARTHILLTPNCSTEAPFEKTYWNILNKEDIHLKMVISEEDPYCKVDEIRRTLRDLQREDLLATTSKGDHNFVVTEEAGPSYKFQDLVIEYVTNFVGQLTP